MLMQSGDMQWLLGGGRAGLGRARASEGLGRPRADPICSKTATLTTQSSMEKTKEKNWGKVLKRERDALVTPITDSNHPNTTGLAEL